MFKQIALRFSNGVKIQDKLVDVLIDPARPLEILSNPTDLMDNETTLGKVISVEVLEEGFFFPEE